MNLLNPNSLRVHFLESPSLVILSAAKNLALPAQDKLREESRSAHFMNIRDSSSPAAPQNDGAYEFFRSLFKPISDHTYAPRSIRKGNFSCIWRLPSWA